MTQATAVSKVNTVFLSLEISIYPDRPCRSFHLQIHQQFLLGRKELTYSLIINEGDLFWSFPPQYFQYQLLLELSSFASKVKIIHIYFIVVPYLTFC